jgi:cytoskeletal protein RodZ
MTPPIPFDDPVTPDELGSTLRHRREAAGVSLSEAARRAKISARALKLRESGQCVGAAEFWRVIYALGYRIKIYRPK